MPPASRDEGPTSVRIVDDRWTVLRHVVEAFAIVAAGVWAFYTFVYQEKIKPASQPAALNPTIDVRLLGRDRRREMLGVTVHLRNDGKTEIDIAADAYNVWGDTYAERQSTSERRTAQTRDYFHGLRRTKRTLIATSAELRDAALSGKTDLHIIIEPGAEQTLSYLVVVPRGIYNVIHAQVVAVPVKTNAPRIHVKILQDKNGGSWLVGNEEDDDETDFALPP